jgi:hypothetical protein
MKQKKESPKLAQEGKVVLSGATKLSKFRNNTQMKNEEFGQGKGRNKIKMRRGERIWG